MKRTLQVEWIDAEVGIQGLFQLEPPFESDYGPQEFVVVSAIDVPDSGPHTFVFAADQSGEVQRWSELYGAKGVKDIWQALRNLGYEPIGLVEPTAESPLTH